MSRSDAAWAWVSPLYEQAKAKELALFKTAVVKFREAQAAADATANQVADAAAAAKAEAEARRDAAADQAWAALKRGKHEYPEAVVGSSIVAFNLFNGRLAPRMSLLVGIGVSIGMRSHLSAKFGVYVAATSKVLSDAVRSQAEAVGLLTPESS